MKKVIISFLIIYLFLMTACGNEETAADLTAKRKRVIERSLEKLETATTYDEILECCKFKSMYEDKDKEILKNKVFDYLFSDTKLNGTYYYNAQFRSGTAAAHMYGTYVEDTIIIYVRNKDEIYFVPVDVVNGDSSVIPYITNANDYKYKAVDIDVSYKDEEKGMSINFIRCIDNYELKIDYYENAGYITIYNVFPYQFDVEGNKTLERSRDYYLDQDASKAASQKLYDKEMKEYQEQESLKNKKTEPKIGMSKREVENSTWGKPDKKNIDKYKWGTSEQWVYDGKGYIYFEDGVVTSIHHR